MPKFNLLVMSLTALIPLLTGWIWYSKMLFNKSWMASASVTEEDLKKGNMAVVFILTYVFSFLICVALNFMVIHQWGMISTLAGDATMQDPNSATGMYLADFMNKYGNNFRTFKHGAFHGVEYTILLIMPVIGIIGLFERKGFKYIAVHTGYWMLTLALMGGVICQWSGNEKLSAVAPVAILF